MPNALSEPATDVLRVPAPLDDATRRQFLGLLAAAGLLTGCGSDSEDASPAARTNRVDTPLGPVEVPIEPQRVVAIEGRQDLDHVLSLDLPLVGYPSNDFGSDVVSPYLVEALARQPAAVSLYTNDVDLEAIAADSPDLIVSRVFEAEEFAAQLGALAPVLAVPSDRPWQEISELIARGVSRLDRHQALLTRYADTAADIQRNRADVLDARVVVFQYYDDNSSYVSGSRSFQGTVIHDAGGRFSAISESEPVDGVELQSERFVDTLEGADAALVIVNNSGQRALLEQNPFWQRSEIARRGRFVTADFFSNGGGPLTALGVAGLVDSLYAALQR